MADLDLHMKRSSVLQVPSWNSWLMRVAWPPFVLPSSSDSYALQQAYMGGFCASAE